MFGGSLPTSWVNLFSLSLVHMTQTFTSSNPLTGRTDRLHIFQTLVPSHRAQVFI